VAWDPNGRAFYFAGFSGGTAAIWRVDVDPRTRTLTGGPHRVAATADVGTSVAVARTSGALVFAAASSIPRVSWYPLDQSGLRISGPPESVTSRELPPADADVTPDGSRLIFTVRRPGGTTVELRTRLLAEPAERPLLVTSTTHGERRQQPKVSPDGRQVVYRYVHPESAGVSGTHNLLLPQQLRLLDVQTAQESELSQTASRFIMPGGFSPDGRSVVASVDLRSTPNQSMSIALFPIAAAPKAEAQMKVVTTVQGDSGLLRPAMSPDGRWIAFEVQGHTARIAVVGSADGLWQEVQPESRWQYLDPVAMYDPHWSEDGRLLYFVSARGGVLNVWAVGFDLVSGKIGTPFQVTEFDGQAHLIPLSTAMIAVARHGLAIRTSHPNGGIWLVERPACTSAPC
jgi:WD40 repeat protein